MAILANNNTHAAIASGQLVYVRGHGTLAEGLYTAKAAIAANDTLSTSNLTAVSGGGLNALNSKINTINSNSNQVRFANISSAATGTIESLGVGNSTYGSYFLLMRIDSSNNGAWAGFVRHNASGYQVSEVYKGEHAQTPYVDSNGIVKTSSTTPITVHAYYMRLSAWN